MCGIFGIINANADVNIDDINIMSNNMIHRGPDDEGILIKNRWAIGMRRLSIIDIEGGHQPISNANNNVHLVANGEIYNYQELRKDLIADGYKFKTNSDVEVILHLYDKYGYDAINYLNGMFAFAIYDEDKNEAWIARDRLGIKPLYLFKTEDSFYFSSELIGLSKVSNSEICNESIIDYLGHSYVPAPKTMFKNIFKLMPGEFMTITNNIVSKKFYWDSSVKNQKKISIDEATNSLNKLFKDSVKLQLISDVPLGVFLSGGVDSSAIASYAAEIRGESKLDTFTIDFDGKDGEDSPFANKISKELKTNHHVISVNAEDQFKSLDELISLMDEPMSDSAIVPTYILSKEARKKGMKVLLSGAGGDEIFGGYPRHYPGKIFSASWFANLPYLLRYFLSSLLSLVNPSYKIRLLKPSRNFVANISGVNFAFLSDLIKSKKEFLALIKRIDKGYEKASSKSMYALMQMDVRDYLPNNILSLTDKATMGASVEGRVPFLDHRMVEFAFSVPEKINIFQNNQKGLFKHMLKGRLPDDLLNRKKEGFNAPIHFWVQKWPDQIKDELLNNISPTLDALINKKTIGDWLNNSKKRAQAGASLYALFVLNKWLRNINK